MPEPYTYMLTTKEREAYDSFSVGDYVRNISTKSRFYGLVGQIVEKDGFSIHVKYQCQTALGRHPALILQRSTGQHFHDDLFTMK